MLHSSNKGKRFERKVAKLLSDWSGIAVARTPMSGAWVGEPGDVVPVVAGTFPFVIECKHEEGWEFDQLLRWLEPFRSWVAQCIEQYEHKLNVTGEVYWPMLFFTRNRRPIYAMLPKHIYELGYAGKLPNHLIIDVPLGGGYLPWQFIVAEAENVLGAISYKKLESNLLLKARLRRLYHGRQKEENPQEGTSSKAA